MNLEELLSCLYAAAFDLADLPTALRNAEPDDEVDAYELAEYADKAEIGMGQALLALIDAACAPVVQNPESALDAIRRAKKKVENFLSPNVAPDGAAAPVFDEKRLRISLVFKAIEGLATEKKFPKKIENFF
ncbi:MAG: hypothetical protein NZ534_09900 [Bacteroidia bacterium]|nr:hypothetical protein [Bacteroidia bacterium]